MTEALPSRAKAKRRAALPSAKVKPSDNTSSQTRGDVRCGRGGCTTIARATGRKAARNQHVADSPDMLLVAIFWKRAATPQRVIGARAKRMLLDARPCSVGTLKR